MQHERQNILQEVSYFRYCFSPTTIKIIIDFHMTGLVFFSDFLADLVMVTFFTLSLSFLKYLLKYVIT